MVSIILPTYNEKENILDLIEALYSSVTEPLEVVVVDDDSPDRTWEIAQSSSREGVKVIRRNERGLATAIGTGIKAAEGEIVGWMDADMCHPPDLLPEMLKHFDDYDVVVGSRYVKGGSDSRGFFRVLTSRIINSFAGIVLGLGVKDADSGFILIKKAVIDEIGFPARGYGDYFIELMYRCRRAGFRIKEVPFTFTDREKGESKSAPDIFGFIKLGAGYVFRIISLRFGK